jgi:Cytochrome P450
MMKKLHEHCVNGPVDMANWFQYVTTDVVGDLTFGESFHCLETSTLHVSRY